MNSKMHKAEQVSINLTLTDYVYEMIKKEADKVNKSLNQLIKEKIINVNY